MCRPLKNANHEEFCQEYLIDANAAKAYERVAGFRAKGHAAAQKAYELRNRPGVAKRIEYLQKRRAVKTGITAERVVQEIACIAFFDPIDLFNDEGRIRPLTDIPERARRAIAGIKIKRTITGKDQDPEELIEIKLAPKSPAHDQLMKHTGGYGKDNAQRSLMIPTDDEIASTREAMAKAW